MSHHEAKARSKVRFGVLPIAVVLLLLVANTVAAVTWGEPTGDEYPHVGTLVFLQTTGLYGCSGTLLSPDVMVTAGHCTEELGVPNFHTWISFDPEIDWPDLDTLQEKIDYLNANWITGTAYPHPDYDDFAEWPKTYDVGVVVLDVAVDLSEYGELPPLGLLDSLSTGKDRKNREFTVVGYGMQGYVPAHFQDHWARYSGTVSLIEVKSKSNGDGHSAKFTNNPGKGNGVGGSCYGDSGGPLFHGEGNLIGAVVSWGATPCVGNDYQFRLDTAIARNFITPFLP